MNGTIGTLTAADTPFLYDIYWWGVGLIKGIQAIENPALTAVMRGLTALGTEMFYIPVILFIFWCVDEKQGLRLTILILFSAWINGFFKSLLKQPRPYNLDPSVMRAFEPSYGIPSGHTQQSLVFWGASLRQALTRGESRRSGPRVPVFAILAGFFIAVIPFTRLYLGVHFPTDILAGWVLGGIILAVSFVFGDRIASLLAAGGTRSQLIIAAAIALLMNASGADRNLGGMFLGVCGGYSLMRKYVPFAALGPVRGRKPGAFILAARYVLGLAGAGAIYLGLRRLLPGEASFLAEIPAWGAASPYYELGRFLRYGLLGLWVSVGAPWLFLRLGLSGGAAPAEQ
ncbi:MAG: phosphatase PAP2 family protein [Treponema sp.]|jgi:membrane-associated phospholipid phosphatase|nr:phosphatase PAP2 family protein [Treponema sp.]